MFLTPARREAWERIMKWRLARIGIALLVTIAVVAVVGPLLERLVPPGPNQTQVAPPSQADVDALFNDLMQRIAKLHDEYNTSVASYLSQIDDIYSPSSFSNRTKAARLIQAVTDFDEVERKYNQALHELPGQALVTADRAGFSNLERSGLVLRLNDKLADFFKAMDEYMTAQHEWAQDTMELYRFTSKYPDKIALEKSRIVIQDVRFRDQFNAQLSRCRESFSRMEAANEKLDEIQKRFAKKS